MMIAPASAAPLDPKLTALVLEIRLIRLAHVRANILVYTEYVDSQRAAVDALAAASFDGAILTISGADPEAARTRAAMRCAEEDGIILVSTDSLAEGLNLHQRCCHLIHLDLPYNPNRLEQRNGRIDRYGQRHDPQIRYLYLAGTFEERLLLRLIAKYEQARACLGFMPNTLGVTADAGGLREPLLAGFAEDRKNLFSDAPRLMHSLDLAAEDTDSDAYRDLLREIDRAFEAFDHMAVRHGWTAGTEPADAPAEPARDAIDVPAFVASVLTLYWSGHRVPPDWTQELDGLAGFSRVDQTVRLTGDPAQVRDGEGRELMYPGRAHPLVRRAVALARAGQSGRMSAARDTPLSLLMTCAAEVAGRSGIVFRRVFALRLFPDGSIMEQPDFLSLSEAGNSLWDHTLPHGARPEAVLSDGALAHHALMDDALMDDAQSRGSLPDTALSDDPASAEAPSDDSLAYDQLWRDRFAGWAPDQIAAAGAVAATTADQLAAGFAAAHRRRAVRDAAIAQAWLDRRTLDLCGAAVPWIGDLFDAAPLVAPWRSCAVAEQRLAGFAADTSVTISLRRDAVEVLSRFQAITADQTALAPAMVRTLGLLMLCP